MKFITIKDAKKLLSKHEKINYIYDYIEDIFYNTSKIEVLKVLTSRLGNEQGIIEFFGYYEGFTKDDIDAIFDHLMNELEEIQGDQNYKISI